MTKTKKETVTEETGRLGEEVVKLGRNFYLFGIGAFATAGEEMKDLFDRYVTKGESIQNDEETLLNRATGKARDLGRRVEDRFQETVSGTLNRAGVPSRNEIRTLIDRVEELTEKVEALGAR